MEKILFRISAVPAIFDPIYIHEEIPATVTEQHIISSDRFVNNKQNGFLPNNILKFFETIEQDKDYEYYRQGVLKTKNTFISCVLSSLKLFTKENYKQISFIYLIF